jgi:hypothetical protein
MKDPQLDAWENARQRRIFWCVALPGFVAAVALLIYVLAHD